LCGIADEPFCPLPNASVASPTSVRCQVADGDRQRSTAVPEARQRQEIRGVPIARHDLRRDHLAAQAQRRQRRLLDGGVEVRVGADRRPRSCRPRSLAG
jgi:hypothetical protein